MGDNVHVVSPEDWLKGIALSVAASVIGGASKLAIRKSWVMLEAHGICTGVGGVGGGGVSSSSHSAAGAGASPPPGAASRIAAKKCCGPGKTRVKRTSSSESTEELLPSGGGGAGLRRGASGDGEDGRDGGGAAVTRSRTPPRNRHSRSPSRSSSGGGTGGGGGGVSSSGVWIREDNAHGADGAGDNDNAGAETEMMEVGRASTYDPVPELLPSGSAASAGSAPARMHHGHPHQPRPDTSIIPQMLVPACGVTATCGVLSAYDGDEEDEGDDDGKGKGKRSVLGEAAYGVGANSFASFGSEGDDNERVELARRDRDSYCPPVAVDAAGDGVVALDRTGSGLPPSSIDTRTFSPRGAPPPSSSAAENAAVETRSKVLRYAGMFGMTVLNPICCVWAMQYASPSILAPFSGLTLVWIVLFSESMVGERPQPVQVFAAGLIIVGEVIVAIFGDHTNDGGVTVDDVRAGYRAPWFIAYMVAIAAWMCFLYTLIVGRGTSPILRRFAWGVAGGSITGLQNFLKDSLTIVKNYSDNLFLLPPLFYLFMACAIMSSLVGLLLLTACMKRYDATYSSSMFVGSFVISASIMAAARYNTFQNLLTIWNFILYPTGLLVLLAGIYVLATHEHKEHGNGNGQAGGHAGGDGGHLHHREHHPHGNGNGGAGHHQEGSVTSGGSKRNPLQKVKDAALGTRKNHAIGASYREII